MKESEGSRTELYFATLTIFIWGLIENIKGVNILLTLGAAIGEA